MSKLARLVSYLRISTDKQGKSGLGLEAQRAAVLSYLNGGDWELLGEYMEVESGKHDDRPELAKAMAQCRLGRAALLVAKLDRLSRDAAFLMNLAKSGIEIRACDLPHANVMMFGIMALVAQHEREAISSHTKAALAAAKARGKVLGGCRGAPPPGAAKASAARQAAADAFAQRVGPMAKAMRDDGRTLQQIADSLAAQGVLTARGGKWSSITVSNLIDRYNAMGQEQTKRAV